MLSDSQETQQPPYAANAYCVGIKRQAVPLGICTHLGCTPRSTRNHLARFLAGWLFLSLPRLQIRSGSARF